MEGKRSLSSDGYIPALRFNFLSPYYDLLNKWAGREAVVHKIIASEIHLDDHTKLLDLGCGTASLLLNLRQLNPNFQAVGIDIDPKILRIAQKKITASSDTKTELIQSSAIDLPFESSSFDTVLSTLVFHHLKPQEKRQSLAEIKRVLKPGGKLLLVDWGKPSNILMRLAFIFVQLLDGFETTSENVEGKLPGMFNEAGFSSVKIIQSLLSIVGSIEIITGLKSASNVRS